MKASTQGPGEVEQILVLNYLWNERLCQDVGEVVFPELRNWLCYSKKVPIIHQLVCKAPSVHYFI